jgi:hypothetical protein
MSDDYCGGDHSNISQQFADAIGQNKTGATP